MVIKNNPDEREAISWNIVSQNSDFISSLLQRATNAGLKGRVQDKFFFLQGVRDNINFSLKTTERGQLDIIEEKFAVLSSKMKKIANFLDSNNSLRTMFKKRFKEEYKRLFLEKVKLIKQYHHALMDFLELLGYFPKRENREKMSF